ncbi:uncharacterized protein PV09_03458 [Verruconis gallopava]|uniref:Oxidoreductase n=1 Tax=Verruconis gallopava TaxID=253628 RepID=A0A0D2AF48_9PEZI|nr:uncharacterized protein PV09_03458 [Verruconis gallopava]KIW05583.1 hypothetical protein PV09_03458 [Verruconis gallopava]
MTFNVGIIGYGLSAKIFHIPYIKATEGLEVKAICQRRASEGNDAAKDHPTSTIYRTSDELLQDPTVDIVVLCTPVATHLTLGKQCLEAGKHVVVEKPFCATVAECDELIDCAKKHNKLLTVFHNRRWDADFQTVLALLQKGTLGRIVEFESHFDRWSPTTSVAWKLQTTPGHGVVYDLGSHLIDQVVFTFGMPKKITAVTSKQRIYTSDAPEDACTILMHYDGMLATIKCSAVSAGTRQLRFWIRGDKGSYKKHFEDPQEVQLLGGMAFDDPNLGKESSDRYGVLSLAENNAISEHVYPTLEPGTYKVFYQKLVQALSEGSPVPVDGAAARNVIRLIELARESARTGRTLEV